MRLLLDTHILVWWAGELGRLSRRQKAALADLTPESPAWVSEITFWEIANLISLGRIELDLPLREWLERATAPPLVRTSGITPAVASEVASLPDSFHRDPADRVLVATARVLDATLATRDRKIIDSRLVPTLK